MTRIRAALAAAAPDLAPEVLDRLAEAATEAAFRITWSPPTEWGTVYGKIGPYGAGAYYRDGGRWWSVPLSGAGADHPTEAAARAALERAVREAVNGQ